MIGELTDTADKRAAEHRRRKKPYVERVFRHDERDYAIQNGWTLVRENRASLRFQKSRELDEQLENEFWRLLFDFGYLNLNVGRNFQITIADKENGTVGKQIDVFAYDGETIIVAECKCAERRIKKPLQKDIGEFTALQRPIAAALRKYFGGKFDQKIIWLFVTRNIDWSENDRARAKSSNIDVITDKEFFYYKEIAKRIGNAARYQFHAEFLAKSKVAALDNVDVNAIKTKLGNYKVYAFFAPAEKLLPITFVNHRDLRDPAAAPSYQRLIQRPRLKGISDFIKAGGFFPNTIILNFKGRPRFDLARPEDDDGITIGTLTLPNTYKSAWIIDGQHRLYGYTEHDAKGKNSLLPFLAFENISISEETKLFSDINSKQKRVEKKLLDEITGEIKLESADKREQMRAIASRVFDLMRDDDDGPLGGKIAGVEIKHSEASVLTIPYLVDAVGSSQVLGRVLPKEGKNTYIQGPLFWDQPQEGIDNLVVLLTEYLRFFQNASPVRWENGKTGRVATNAGVSGMLRLLADVIAFMAKEEGEDPRTLDAKTLAERLEKYVEPCATLLKNATDHEIEQRFQIPFGSGGPRIFQHRLRELIGLQFPRFDAPGYKDDLRKYDEERTRKADQMVRSIQERVHEYVIGELKTHYGPGDDYLERAIENREILKKAYEKKLDADEKDRKDMGTYFDFLDLKKIVESPKNWNYFSVKLSIKLGSEKKGKAKYTQWFEEINKTRRVSAHPYNRGYSDEEFALLEFVYKSLTDTGIVQA